MLSTRLNHPHLWADKENGMPAGGVSTRKAASSYTSQSASLMTAKTPGAKLSSNSTLRGLSKTAAKPSFQSGKTMSTSTDAKPVPRTVGLEPGARVLGAKDANNTRVAGSQTILRDKGKARAVEADPEFSKIAPAVLFKDVKAGNAQLSATRPAQASAKTPLKASLPTLRTPARKVSTTKTPARQLATPNPMFKTPSPNMLNRRRPGQFSPPVDFGPPAELPPTQLELTLARIDAIDIDQPVEYAGRSALEFDAPYEPEFPMPDYKTLPIQDILFAPLKQFMMTHGGLTDEELAVPYVDIPEDDASSGRGTPDPDVPDIIVHPAAPKTASARDRKQRPVKAVMPAQRTAHTSAMKRETGIARVTPTQSTKVARATSNVRRPPAKPASKQAKFAVYEEEEFKLPRMTVRL